MDRIDVQTFRGEQLERAVLPFQVNRADLGDHDAADLADDPIELFLAVVLFGHDFAEAAHDHPERRFARENSDIVASRHHGSANRTACPGGFFV
jgi:hypothetical protein